MIKKHLFDALLCFVTFIFIIAGFANAANAGKYAYFSLRYNAAVSGADAYNARVYSVGRDDAFWPSFWREYETVLSNGYSSVRCTAIAFSGDASMVWPADYIIGNAPGETDETGVSVSQALALRLWGSVDIVNMPVEADGVNRVVRGVFESDNEMALIAFPAGGTSWNAAELFGGINNAVRSDAESYALASGLGLPDTIISAGIPSFARAMALAPVFVLFMYAIVNAMVYLRKKYRSAFLPALFASLILFALILPKLLDMLPPWLIPTMWSDFSFWGSLINSGIAGLKEFLRATPYARDVELKLLLIKQSAILLFALCGSVAICIRFLKQRER